MASSSWTSLRVGSVSLAMAVLSACGGSSEPTDGGSDMDSGVAGVDCATEADGTACGGTALCVGGACVEARCGDGYVDTATGEQCEDGNLIGFDGCEPGTCQYTCASGAVCDDGEPCNGAEACSAAHVCVSGTALAPGTDCSTAAVSGGVCRGSGSMAECANAGCGNGVVDGTEDCDDMNEVIGDGCDNDCTFTCALAADCVALDTNVCDGPDVCRLTDHLCVPSTPLDCADAIACTDDTCDPVMGCVHTDNGTGTFFYADCDGDDYAAGELGSVQSCLTPTSAPAVCGAGGGWTSRRPLTGDTDCLDRNANVHPGANAYQATPISGVPAAADFDYNCDGVEEPLGYDTLPCASGDYHYDTRVGWSPALCGMAWSVYKYVCPTPTAAGYWARFSSGDDARVPCR